MTFVHRLQAHERSWTNRHECYHSASPTFLFLRVSSQLRAHTICVALGSPPVSSCGHLQPAFSGVRCSSCQPLSPSCLDPVISWFLNCLKGGVHAAVQRRVPGLRGRFGLSGLKPPFSCRCPPVRADLMTTLTGSAQPVSPGPGTGGAELREGLRRVRIIADKEPNASAVGYAPAATGRRC